MQTEPVLCADLDGTVIETDLLQESICAAIKRNPLYLFMLFVWLLRGRAHLKAKLAELVQIDASLLPYNEKFVEYLRAQKQSGRKVVLATASDLALAKGVYDHLGCFDEILASDGKYNLRGSNKARYLREKYRDFAYAGNSTVDFPVWRAAKQVILVSSEESLIKRVTREFAGALCFPGYKFSLLKLVRALRTHQWLKNLLIFVPLIMAHRWQELPKSFSTLVAFFSFSLCASSVYILNDLFDLESDRQHHSKRNRPFASGALPLALGFALVPLLFLSALLLSFSSTKDFTLTLVLYFIITLFYSLRLKRILLLDIVTLASLYTVRIFAGGVAADVPVSEWLLAFSMFIFFSLACLKRYSELHNLLRTQKEKTLGRGYLVSDLTQISQFGSSSAYISVLVLALYIRSPEVLALYHHPMVLWAVCPVLLYWVSRMWLLAHRGEIDEDPIVFAIEDKVSIIVAFLALVLVLAAI